MHEISWEDVASNPLFQGGEILVFERGADNNTYRGPIEHIEIKGENIYFHLRWCANLHSAPSGWFVAEPETAGIFDTRTTTATLLQNGDLLIQAPWIIHGIVFCRGTSQLDPKEVAGLDLENLLRPKVITLG